VCTSARLGHTPLRRDFPNAGVQPGVNEIGSNAKPRIPTWVRPKVIARIADHVPIPGRLAVGNFDEIVLISGLIEKSRWYFNHFSLVNRDKLIVTS